MALNRGDDGGLGDSFNPTGAAYYSTPDDNEYGLSLAELQQLEAARVAAATAAQKSAAQNFLEGYYGGFGNLSPEEKAMLYGSRGLRFGGWYPSLYGGQVAHFVPNMDYFDTLGAWRGGGEAFTGWTPEDKAALDAFQKAYPGYAQINPQAITKDYQGNLAIANQDASTQGGYIAYDPNDPYSTFKYDPEYGLLAPLTSFGRSGEPNAFWQQGFGRGLLTIASAAAPFAGAYLAGVPVADIGAGSVLKGAALGGLGGAATSGGDPGAIIKGIIGGAASPVAGAAAGSIVDKVGLDPGLFTDVAQGAIKGGIQGVGGGPQGILTGALGGGVGGALSGVGNTVGNALTDIFTPDAELPLNLADAGGISQAPGGTATDAASVLGLPGGPTNLEMTPAPLGAVPSAADILGLPGGFTPTPGANITAAPPSPGLFGQNAPLPVSPAGADYEGTYTPEQEAAALQDTARVETAGAVQQAGQYLKTAKSLYDVYKSLTGEDLNVPQYSPPPRQEGQSDIQYADQVVTDVVDYLDLPTLSELGIDVSGLDLDSLAQSGVTPGSPEYLDLVLDAIDDIIAQITGMDPSALLEGETTEMLQQLVRGKSSRETQALQRALYARGGLDSLTTNRTAIDPFTGREQVINAGEGGPRQGATAAYQRGLADLGQQFGSARGGSEFRGMLDEFLNRDVDLFGASAGQAKRRKQAEQAGALVQDDELRKRLGYSVAEWQQLLRDPGFLQELLGG